jgi:hypothetical protein
VDVNRAWVDVLDDVTQGRLRRARPIREDQCGHGHDESAADEDAQQHLRSAARSDRASPHSPNGSRISLATVIAVTLDAIVITRAQVPSSMGHS